MEKARTKKHRRINNIVTTFAIAVFLLNAGLAIANQNPHAVTGWILVTAVFIEKTWLWNRVRYLRNLTNTLEDTLFQAQIAQDLLDLSPTEVKQAIREAFDKLKDKTPGPQTDPSKPL